MTLCCDASANFGSKPVDISKYGVIYAAVRYRIALCRAEHLNVFAQGHKNFTTSGVCYTIIRKDLIDENVLPGTPTMCNWHRFQTAPGKMWTVPEVFAIWLGQLQTEWMLERGGLEYFEDLAIRRSNLLYELIDSSGGFYNCFVNQQRFRSRMQVVFTIGDG